MKITRPNTKRKKERKEKKRGGGKEEGEKGKTISFTTFNILKS